MVSGSHAAAAAEPGPGPVVTRARQLRLPGAGESPLSRCTVTVRGTAAGPRLKTRLSRVRVDSEAIISNHSEPVGGESVGRTQPFFRTPSLRLATRPPESSGPGPGQTWAGPGHWHRAAAGPPPAGAKSYTQGRGPNLCWKIISDARASRRAQ